MKSRNDTKTAAVIRTSVEEKPHPASVLLLRHGDYSLGVRIEKRAHSLIPEGHEITLMYRNRFGQPDSDIIDGIRVTRIRCRPLKYPGGCLLSCRLRFVDRKGMKAMERFRDGWPVHAFHVPDLPLVKTCPAIGKKRNIPVAFDRHGNRPEKRGLGRRLRENNAFVGMRDRFRNPFLYNKRRDIVPAGSEEEMA